MTVVKECNLFSLTVLKGYQFRVWQRTLLPSLLTACIKRDLIHTLKCNSLPHKGEFPQQLPKSIQLWACPKHMKECGRDLFTLITSWI